MLCWKIMELKLFWLALVFSTYNVLLSEGSANNQTNSTQSYNQSTTVVTPSTTESSQVNSLVTPSSSSTSAANPSSSSSSLISSSFTSVIEPSSSSVQATSSLSESALQISANDGSSSGRQSKYIPLPPENERRDYDLVAHTKLRWVRYLLDKSGPEFSVLKQHIEDHLNEVFKDIEGFVKIEVTEFQEEKVTFYSIIYTKKSSQVLKSALEAALRSFMFSKKFQSLNIYAFRISPRFNDMPNDGRVARFGLPPQGEPIEKVDGAINFLQGFGAMLAIIVVFASIGFIRYKACNSTKKENSDQKESLQEAHYNEVVE